MANVSDSGIVRDGQPKLRFDDGVVKGATVALVDATRLRLRRRGHLRWHSGHPRTCLIVKKPNNDEASRMMRVIGQWLSDRGLQMYCELAVHQEFRDIFAPYSEAPSGVDLCITLGGDGTVMYMAGMFPDNAPLPPVVSFALGTLGFLTPFDVNNYMNCLNRILGAGRDEQTPLYCTLRSRKHCEVYFGGQLQRVHHVLNECTVDRGLYPNTLDLEVFVDGEYVTTVQADGLIIATPTGSTAYSMSAGGPMVAPSVPSTLLTPIAPLSLSFRPLVIPESSEVTVHLPCESRSTGRVSFDGRFATNLELGGYIRMTTSQFPIPIVNMYRLDRDWYQGITHKLGWNKSIRRRSLPGTFELAPENLLEDGCGVGEGATCSNSNGVNGSAPDEGWFDLNDTKLGQRSQQQQQQQQTQQEVQPEQKEQGAASGESN